MQNFAMTESVQWEYKILWYVVSTVFFIMCVLYVSEMVKVLIYTDKVVALR